MFRTLFDCFLFQVYWFLKTTIMIYFIIIYHNQFFKLLATMIYSPAISFSFYGFEDPQLLFSSPSGNLCGNDLTDTTSILTTSESTSSTSTSLMSCRYVFPKFWWTPPPYCSYASHLRLNRSSLLLLTPVPHRLLHR